MELEKNKDQIKMAVELMMDSIKLFEQHLINSFEVFI